MNRLIDFLKHKFGSMPDPTRGISPQSSDESRPGPEGMNDRLAFALSVAGVGIWEWEIATGKIIWSETQEKLFGFAPGTFPGTYEAYRRCIPPEDFDRMEVSLTKALAERVDHLTEHRVILADGTVRWIQGRGRARFDDNGNPVRMAGTSLDITDRKLAWEVLKRNSAELEEITKRKNTELLKSHEFLNSLVENLPNMVFVKDARELRFVRFNRAGENLLGYSREALLGKNDYDFFPKEQADFFTEKDRAVLRGHAIVDIPEEEIQTSANGKRILHTKKIPVFGADGMPEYLLGISEDITEYKEAEDHRLRLLKEQAARVEADLAARRSQFLSETSDLLASVLDGRETLRRLAEYNVPIIGDQCVIALATEESPAENWLTSVTSDREDDAPVDAELSRMLGQVIRSGRGGFFPEADTDLRLRPLATRLKLKSCVIVPINLREETVGALFLAYSESAKNAGKKYSLQDFSMIEELGRRAGIAVENSRLYEQAQRAIQLRSEFLSIASHELKTPITSIKLQIQMARRKVQPTLGLTLTPERLAQILDSSEKQVDRLADLIEDLLDVSRIEAGRLTYVFERENLSTIVREVLDRHADQLAAAKCVITFELQDEVFVLGDRFRLEQVVLNLLTNAMKYGAERPVKVSVEAREKRAIFIVRDYGMGVPKEEQDRIFDRFERAVSYQHISGLGLGLYISKQIVLGHSGTIHVESDVGVGSQFVVELPLVSQS